MTEADSQKIVEAINGLKHSVDDISNVLVLWLKEINQTIYNGNDSVNSRLGEIRHTNYEGFSNIAEQFERHAEEVEIDADDTMGCTCSDKGIDYQTAKAMMDYGLTVLPACRRLKQPVVKVWRKYTKQKPTDKELHEWFDAGESGVCVVCGESSGALEVIDFDGQFDTFKPWIWKLRKTSEGMKLLKRLVIEKTPSGGYHVFYRNDNPRIFRSSLILLKHTDTSILVETKGDGNVCLCYPTEGYELLQGSLENIPVLKDDERQLLLSTAMGITEYEYSGNEYRVTWN